jgi:hypothetical protein
MSELEAQDEARREAAPAVLVALALLMVLALASREAGWQLLHRLPWWSWLVLAVPELVLTIDLVLRVRGMGIMRTRRVALALLGLLVLANLVALLILVAALVTTSTQDLGGGELLLTAFVIWATNVIVFGIWFWEIDVGGPVARAMRGRALPDFQFPQDENPELALPRGVPGSGTTSISPSRTRSRSARPTRCRSHAMRRRSWGSSPASRSSRCCSSPRAP